MDNSQVESVWVRLGKEASTGNIAVGECYRPPHLSKEADKPSLNSSGSHALVPIGDFNLPDICGKSNVVGCKQSRRFLECVGDNSLIEVVDRPVKGDTQLDLLLTATQGPAGDAVIIGMPGSSYHEIAET